MRRGRPLRSGPLKRLRPLKRVTPLASSGRLPPRRVKPRRGPKRAPAYLDFVRGLPCAAPGAPAGCEGSVQAHHAGVRGLGQRAADDTAVPMCREHHGGWHDGRGAFRGWDRESRQAWAEGVVAATQRRWAETHPPG